MTTFRSMRRIKQQLSDEVTLSILKNASSGVLALLGDDDYPYAVPISFVYADGRLYFHTALEGHKVDAIRKCDKASFCVVDKDDVHGHEYTTYFRSVIAFGRVHLVENQDEKVAAARMLGNRYNPNNDAELEQELAKGLSRMMMIRFDIEHLTGKEAIELVRGRRA